MSSLSFGFHKRESNLFLTKWVLDRRRQLIFGVACLCVVFEALDLGWEQGRLAHRLSIVGRQGSLILFVFDVESKVQAWLPKKRLLLLPRSAFFF